MNTTCRLCGDEIDESHGSEWSNELILHHECACAIDDHHALKQGWDYVSREESDALDRILGNNEGLRDRARAYAAIALDPERARGLLE